MAKPTFMQTLLGRPSQTYSFPSEKAYFSSKPNMLRLAAEANQRPAPPTTVVVHAGTHAGASQGSFRASTSSPYADQKSHHQNSITQVIAEEQQLSIADSEEGGSDSDDDVFYTPATSPRMSLAPSYTPSSRVLSTKTSLTHANTSTTSVSSSSLDAHSLFSVALSDTTSTMTTPPPSDSSRRTATETVSDKDKARTRMPAKSTTTPARRQTTAASVRPQHPTPKSQTQYRKKPNTSMVKSFSKNTPTIMTSMTALLEEEELHDRSRIHPPRPSVIITTSRRAVPSHIPPRPRLQQRRSRSLGHTNAPRISSPLSSHMERPSSRASSTHSHSSSQKSHSKYPSSSVEHYDPASTSLPTFPIGELPSNGTPGFTSLVLPRTPVPLLHQSRQRTGILTSVSGPKHGSDGRVDLTRSGVAQTTMASVEVVRGLSGDPTSKKFMGLFRRTSTSSRGPSPSIYHRPRSQSEDGGARKAQERRSRPGGEELPLGFTSYRTPPRYVPSGSILVQVWAVGIDGVDKQLVFGSCSTSVSAPAKKRTVVSEPRRNNSSIPLAPPRRSISLRSTFSRLGGSAPPSPSSSTSQPGATLTSSSSGSTPPAAVGYIPGRSFTGRVLECGWEVGEDEVKRGDWVVGLLDVRKCGALAEFVVIDRHRIHRIPHPRMDSLSWSGPSTGKSITPDRSPGKYPHTPERQKSQDSELSLDELTLLPLCGIPAYRAVRTFALAFSDTGSYSDSRHIPEGGGWSSEFGSIDADGPPFQKSKNAKGKEKELFGNTSPVIREWANGHRRRALVLRGHDGAGALAVQMLVKLGWRVCVHAPYTCLAEEEAGLDQVEHEKLERSKAVWERECMQKVEERIRAWGGEEVIFDDGEVGGGEGDDTRGPIVRVIEQLYEDGDVFDGVLDTVGGKEVWEASERLLKSTGKIDGNLRREKVKRAGGSEYEVKQFTTLVGDTPGRAIPSAGDHFKAGLRSLNFGVGAGRREGKDGKKVGYAWVNLGQDVDWEGEGIRETLGAVLRMAMMEGVRPWVGPDYEGHKQRLIPFERAPEAFVHVKGDILAQGGTMVVKVVG